MQPIALELSLALALVSALGGCGVGAPGVDASGDTNRSPGVLEIGTHAEDGTFTPWTNEEVIALVWGAQGGVMVTPAIALDGSLVSAATPSLVVQIQNFDADTGAEVTDFASFGPLVSVFSRRGARIVTPPLFDQLGWTDLAGRRVRLHAHVEGSGVVADGEVVILLGSAGVMPPTPG